MNSARRRAAFLDRDGVINVDHGYVYRPDQLNLTPTAIQGIRILNDAGYLVVVATNQSGVARGMFTCAQVEAFHRHMARVLTGGGARIDAFYYCPFHPEGAVSSFRREHEDRKPAPGMLLRAIADLNIDPEASFLIGDRSRDIDAARSAGVTGFLIESDTGDLAEMVRQAIRPARR